MIDEKKGRYSFTPGLEEACIASSSVLTPKEAEDKLHGDFLVGVLLNNRSGWFNKLLDNFYSMLKQDYLGRNYVEYAAIIPGTIDRMLSNPKLDFSAQSKLADFSNREFHGNHTYAQIHSPKSTLKVKTYNGPVDENNFTPVMSMNYVCIPPVNNATGEILLEEGEEITETYNLLSAYAPFDHRALNTFLMLMSGTDGRMLGHPLSSAGIDYILGNVTSVEAKIKAELWGDSKISLTISDTVNEYGVGMYKEGYSFMEQHEQKHSMLINDIGNGRFSVNLMLTK